MAGCCGGEEDNYLLPFFWQHGEDEATLREYMNVIHDAGIRAVCLETRPHPDFAGYANGASGRSTSGRNMRISGRSMYGEAV